jgi:hypothetical protein
MNVIWQLARIIIINNIKQPQKRAHWDCLIYGFTHRPIRTLRQVFFHKKSL